MERTPQIDYSVIAERIGATSIVGFGESTHGAHEFFQTKVNVFKELVQHHGFNTFFLESLDDRCTEIDKYIQTGEGQPEHLVNNLFYFYRTREILDLVTWLHKQWSQYPVRFIGIDERRYVSDYASGYDSDKTNLRDERMALVVKNYVERNPGTKAMIWAHDTHVAAYIGSPEWAPDTRHITTGEKLRSWFGGEYYSIAQLFGSGYFNAALIEESGAADSSKLVPHYARRVSKWFWENRFAKEISEPTFLEGPTFGGIASSSETLYKRALGWGVRRSVMHDQNNVTYVDIAKAFDAVVFFPKVTTNHLIDTQ